MSTPIPVEPTDGGDGGSYPPVTPTPGGSTPTPPPTPPPAPPAPPAPTARTSSLVQEVDLPLDCEVIPLSAVPSQTLAVALGNQNCTIKVYTRSTGLYLDLYVSDAPIAIGVICLDRNIMVRAAYLGFIGELVFIDSQGYSDPTWDGLGSRYNMVWLDY